MTMLLSTQLLPLAALDNVLEVVLPIFFMILYAVSQLLTAKKQAPKQGRPPKLEVHLPGDPPGGPDGQGADKPVGLEATLRKEVDEFLRRSQGKQDERKKRRGQFGDKPARPQSGRRQPQQASSSQSSRETIRRAAARRESTHEPGKARGERERHLATPPSLAAESLAKKDRSTIPSRTSLGRHSTAERESLGKLADPLAGNLRSQSVTAHVATHINQRSQVIGQHAEHLGDTLEVTSRQTQRRIEQKFDHQIGSIRHQEEAFTVEERNLAEEVADLLHSPEGMRQLIIANEILNRPVH